MKREVVPTAPTKATSDSTRLWLTLAKSGASVYHRHYLTLNLRRRHINPATYLLIHLFLTICYSCSPLLVSFRVLYSLFVHILPWSKLNVGLYFTLLCTSTLHYVANFALLLSTLHANFTLLHSSMHYVANFALRNREMLCVADLKSDLPTTSLLSSVNTTGVNVTATHIGFDSTLKKS